MDAEIYNRGRSAGEALVKLLRGWLVGDTVIR